MTRTAQVVAPDPSELLLKGATAQERLLSLRELGHTLRTPLSAIIGFAEILAQDTGPMNEQTYREYAEIIRQSGVEMLQLVNATLAGAADEIRASAE